MHQTARHGPPPAPPDPAELTALCRALALLCETSAARELTRREWGYLNSGVCELAGRVRQYGFTVAAAAAELAEARAEAFEAGRAAGRRRAPRRGQGQLWPPAVPGAPRAVIPLALLAGLRHWARTHVLPAASLAAVVSLGAGTYVTLPDTGRAVKPAPAAVSLAPAGAVLIPPSRSPAYKGRHARTEASAIRVITRPATRAPASASPSPHRSPSRPPAPGELDVTQEEITPGPDGTARIDLTAIGGPVTWSAAVPAGVQMSAHGGTIPAGGVTEVTVTIPPGTTGAITLTAPGQPPAAVALDAAPVRVLADLSQAPQGSQAAPGRHRRR